MADVRSTKPSKVVNNVFNMKDAPTKDLSLDIQWQDVLELCQEDEEVQKRLVAKARARRMKELRDEMKWLEEADG